MINELKKNGVIIEQVYYCPHIGNECDCRKPKLGLFYRAQKDSFLKTKLFILVNVPEKYPVFAILNSFLFFYHLSCFRKPKLGLFYRAQKDYDIDFSKSYAIGDKLRDLAICTYMRAIIDLLYYYPIFL